MQRKKTNQSLGVLYVTSSTARLETITNQTNASIGKSVLPVHLCTIKTSYITHIISLNEGQACIEVKKKDPYILIYPQKSTSKGKRQINHQEYYTQLAQLQDEKLSQTKLTQVLVNLYYLCIFVQSRRVI